MIGSKTPQGDGPRAARNPRLRLVKARIRQVLGAIAALIDRAAGAIGGLRASLFAWPVFIGMGLGIGVLELWQPLFTAGVMKRRATTTFTHQSLLAVLAGTGAAVVVGALASFVRKRRGDLRPFADVFRDTLGRLGFLAALPLVVALSQPLEILHTSLVLGFAFVTGTLFTYSAYQWFSRRTEPRLSDKVRGRAAWVALALLMIGYSAIAAWLSIANHLSFNTGRSDLGFYVNIFRQSSQGIPLGCSLCGGSHLTGHFDPILVPLSVFYLIYPFAETPLVLQTLWLASGAMPVYLLTKHHTAHRGVALALAFAYLLYPALHGVNLFDFHSLALCIPLFVWFLYFLETRRTTAYYVMLPVLLLVREDIAIALVLVGLYCLFGGQRDRVRQGWITILASVVYFVIAKVGFMGHMDPLNTTNVASVGGEVAKGGYAYYYEELIPPGSSTSGLIATLIGDPVYTITRVFTEDKLEYVANLVVPLLLLPFLGRGKVLVVYGLALTLLATREFVYSVHFQYSSLLVPFVFVLAASALGRIRSGDIRFQSLDGPRLVRALGVGIVATSLLSSWKFGGLVPNQSFRAGFRPLVRETSPSGLALDGWLRKLSRSFPKGASVAASSRVLTHLGSVTKLYMYDEGIDVDYVVVGIKNRQVARQIGIDEARGALVQVDKFDDVRVYKATHKRLPPPSRPRPGKAPPKPLEDD